MLSNPALLVKGLRPIKNSSRSAHFEHTVAVTREGAEVLTRI